MPAKSEGERKRGMGVGYAMRGHTIGEAAIGDTPIFISTQHWAPIFLFGFTFRMTATPERFQERYNKGRLKSWFKTSQFKKR